MKNALGYLLSSKLRNEVMAGAKDYEMWELVFPQGFKGVAAKASKSTNMGKISATNLLGYYANEWRDDSSKEELVSYVDEIVSLQRKRDAYSRRQMSDMYNAISLYPKEGSREWRVKQQITHATFQTISRAKKLTAILSACCADYSIGDYRGIGFLFDPAFKETFVQLLKHDYEWKADDSVYFERFIADINTCTWIYSHEELSEGEEQRLFISLLATYLTACLVGPGSFVYQLGYEPKSETLIDEPFVKVTTSQTLCYQLQPVVFTSYDIYSYYTDATDPIRFTNEEVLRFGRSDNTSMNWLGEHRAVVVQDDERTVSRMHAELRHVKGKGWFLFDMGTPNGTTVFRAYGGGVVYCSRESDEVERCIRINTGDVFFLGPSATSRKEAPGRAFVDIGARNKAFRFERVIE